MNNVKTLKKLHIRFFTIFLIVISLIGLLSLTVNAEDGYEIYDIKIDVSLNEDGSADITEVWDVEISPSTNGTEWYLIKGNLNGSKITDFKVSENGQEFSNIGDNWNVNASREQKANMCGTTPNKTQNGLELCWGIGTYGRHKFTVSYHVTEVVDAYSDKDGFNWRFVNDKLSAIPKNVSVKITAPFDITKDNARIWAFGNTGKIKFVKDEGQNGYILATAKGEEYNSESSHMTVVSGFDKGLFKPTKSGSGTFEELVKTAKKGSSYKENDNGAFPYMLREIFYYILAFGIPFVFAFLFKGRKVTDALPKVKISGPERKNVDYSREIPFNKNLEATYAGLYCLNATEKNRDLFTAYLLKWLYEKHIAFKQTEAKSFLNLGTKMQNSIVFKTEFLPTGTSISEILVYGYLKAAAGTDDILQEKELEEYAKKNYDRYFSLLEDAAKDGAYGLIEESILLVSENTGVKAFFRGKKSYTILPGGKEKLLKILGFKRYLKDFTLLGEREIKEITLWKDYLVFAGLFGIAKEVAKQLEELNPNILKEFQSDVGSDISFYNVIRMADIMSSTTSRAADAGQKAASGGGGGSSSGGGGGFSGGGSGGGSR
ncbi:MAG: DUF2207 domain-containing protein [Ruminococcaceae bacterium]|nr:DUF2207 domain-containing protein [Oscillospiraceae bacterium]